MPRATGTANPALCLPSKLYALYKPANWKVSEEARNDSFRILVASPDGASTVDFFWARNEQGRPDALWLVKTYKQFLSQTYPEVSFSEIFAARDATRAMATVSYRTAKTLVKGHYYFESAATGISAQGYLAHRRRNCPRKDPILLNVMASLAFAKAQGQRPDARAPQQAPLQVSLVPRRARIGSLAMRTPPDWNFLAAGGKVITGSRDGGTGFIFTSLQGVPMLANANIAQGVMGVPTVRLPKPCHWCCGPLATAIFGCCPPALTPRTAQEYAMYTRGARCDAQDVVAQWTSAAGADCQGAIKVICGLPSPTGIWTMILAGVWAPASDFGRDLPVLEQVAASFGINDQYARQYIQNGLENLRRLQEEANQAMRDLNRAREQNQADWEARQERKAYMDSKWDDYRRGNSY